MAYNTVQFEVLDGVALVTLDRPDNANTVTPEFSREFKSVMETCRDDTSIRAVVLAANGKFFSAGGDLAGFAAEGDNLPTALSDMVDDFHPAVEIMATMDAPVIAAVQGPAAGAGLSLVAAANFAIASEKASFTMAYTAAGLSPDGSSSYFLPRLIGMRKTEELMLTNRSLSAEEAESWGIINRVVPVDDVMEQAVSMAKKLAKGPTKAFGKVRHLLNATFANDLHSQLELEKAGIVGQAESHDGREGIAAFLEKRRPEFTGR